MSSIKCAGNIQAVIIINSAVQLKGKTSSKMEKNKLLCM